MRYLFDANACIGLMNDSAPRLLARMRRHAPSDIGLPAPVLFELYFGAFKSRYQERNLAVVGNLGFEVVPFDASDARTAGAIRAQLEHAGRPIGPFDTLIAGQALARGLVLVTANTGEFSRVAGLDCEDWSR